MYFTASKVLWILAAPLNALVLLGLAGLVLLLTRFRRTGWWLVATCLGGIIVLGTLPVGTLLYRGLEDAVPRWQDDGRPIAGVIVLGGVFDAQTSDYRRQLTFADTGERLTAMATWVRNRPDLPVVFTGGAGNLVGTVPSEGEVLQRFVGELGIAQGRVLFETRSRNTVENALFTRDLLKPRPGDRFVLVTSAAHMPRALGIFRQAGLDVLPWPVDYRSRPLDDGVFSTNLVEGLSRVDLSLREWIGVVAARLLGQTPSLLPRP
ncbi:YdcF family protein [Alsobacter sp. R-9]